MKILTVLGTRPEIIRLSRIIPKLDALCEQIVVHTGQNFDVTLNDIFFQEFGLRQPDHFINARGTFAEQIASIIAGMERVLLATKPDKFLVLGDTNSSLAAIVAKRLGIPVYHMEAGNRCYDDRVPEEVNRRLIDHSSDVLMPYTERSRANLLREGIEGRRIFVTGNPIFEVLKHNESAIQKADVLRRLSLTANRYFLVTMHRAENVDVPQRLSRLIDAFDRLHEQHDVPVIVSTHPHTRKSMQLFGVAPRSANVHLCEPFGFFDFVALERQALCVLSDSGTVQEECAILKVRNVTIRDTTERPETLECGNNILSGADVDSVVRCVRVMMQRNSPPVAPSEYLMENVSETVCQLVLGHRYAGTCGSHSA